MSGFFGRVPKEVKQGFLFAFLAMVLAVGLLLWWGVDSQTQLVGTLGIGIIVYAGVVWSGFRKNKP